MAHRRGDGSLFRRGRIYYYSFYESGKQVQRSTKSEKLEDAKKWRDKFLGKKLRGEINSSVERVLCGELLDDLLADAATHCKSETVRVWTWTIEASVRPFFGHLKAASLTSKLFQEYRVKKVGEGLSDTTVNRHLALLRMALNVGRKQTPPKVGIIPHFTMTKEDNARKGFLADEQYAALRDAIEDSGLRSFFVIAFHTGIRKGELLAIRVSQIDFERGFITLYGDATKSGESRIVPIFEGEMEAYTRLAAKGKRGEDRLFTWEDGTPIRDFRGSWDAACKKAKVKDLHVHDLRRTACMALRRAGVPQYVRMKIMGHKTPSMEQRYSIIDTEDFEIAKTLMKVKNGKTGK